MSRVQPLPRRQTRAHGHDSRGRTADLEPLTTAMMPIAERGLQGEDRIFRRAIAMAIRAAATSCSVLIVGETGTGKELVARAIHDASPRMGGPMVAVNCGAITRELIGSELFGHEQGSFTGATSARDGVFVQANGGTLFLDELGELPKEQQPHLLRVLETRKVRPLGGNKERAIDVRMIAATNRIVGLGGPGSPLRLDLYHRVATVIVPLPPLRERPGDIPILVRAFMSELGPDLGERTIAPATMRALIDYPWPGNVRELRQAVRRAMTLCRDELTLDQLLPHVKPGSTRGRRRVNRGRQKRRMRICPRTTASLRPIDLIIRDALIDALQRHASMRSAADSLGLAKSTFSDWARRLGIQLS